MEIYNNLNKYRYRLQHKQTGKISYFDTWCYGNIYDQINQYKTNLKAACLLNVSSDTHAIIEVIHLFNYKTIYESKGADYDNK